MNDTTSITITGIKKGANITALFAAVYELSQQQGSAFSGLFKKNTPSQIWELTDKYVPRPKVVPLRRRTDTQTPTFPSAA